MAEILVKAADASNPDAASDRSAYKTGDVVFIANDGHQWGRMEGMPTFAVLMVPGVSPGAFLDLLAAQVEDDAGSPMVDDAGNPMVFRRRRWRLDTALAPAGVVDQLIATGVATVSLADVYACARRTRDDAPYSG